MGRLSRALTISTMFLATAQVAAQVHAPAFNDVQISVDSGVVQNDTERRAVIFQEVVSVSDSSWLRLRFDQATLGAAPAGGEPTVLRITSLFDGHVQHMTQDHLIQWRFTSAYFNGNAILLEIISDPGAGTSHVIVGRADAGTIFPNQPTSICGPLDDRLPSDDPRSGRIVPIGCTGWLINDANNCMLTAGHCTGGGFEVLEFNVPLSNSNGTIVHPGPEDQYAIDFSSLIGNGGQGTGNDWAYFGCFDNSETGLTAAEAQGDVFVVVDPPAVFTQSIRITGFGTTSSGVPAEWNQAQKTHLGPYVTFSGTLVQYTTDTTGGNSGSPVILEETGEAIGIHTHGGCNSGDGQNSGTGANHPDLMSALLAPQGVCLPLGPVAFEYPDGRPALIDDDGDAIRVEVVGEDGGMPEPGTGTLFYRAANGGSFTSVPMVEITPNVYDAVFPSFACGEIIEYYVSGDATDGETVTDPRTAPTQVFVTQVGDSLDASFGDDFETDMNWTVTNDAGLTTGMWERGVPAGFGDRGDPAADADGSGQCYVTGIADGNNDIDGGFTTLTSPIMDATDGDAHITYWSWLDNSFSAAPFEDPMVVEISSDGGGSWVNLETIGPAGNEASGGWFYKSFRVADVITLTDQFRIRFVVGDGGSPSVVEAGVDGVRLNLSETGISCDDEGTCAGDANGDGLVNVDDVLAVLGDYGCDGCDATDFDDDGDTDIDDLLAVLGAWGACP